MKRKRDSPQALHIVLPSASLLQRGVEVVWQFAHSVGRGDAAESTRSSEVCVAMSGSQDKRNCGRRD